MRIDEQCLQQITMDVCTSMLGLELKPVPVDRNTEQQMVASVEIHGERRTVVEVFANDFLIANIAGAMYCSDHGNLSESDIRDAFCEIANMIGGNIKGSFGEEADLTLPKMGQPQDWSDELLDDSLHTTFECFDHPLSIVVREMAMQHQLSAAVAAQAIS